MTEKSNEGRATAQVLPTTSGTLSTVPLIDPATTAATESAPIFSVSFATRDHNANDERIESAVYSHIQALRTLGHTRVNTVRIAKALNLKQRIVDRAVADLRAKGVEPVHG
jgi:hypothetical protein